MKLPNSLQLGLMIDNSKHYNVTSCTFSCNLLNYIRKIVKHIFMSF